MSEESTWEAFARQRRKMAAIRAGTEDKPPRKKRATGPSKRDYFTREAILRKWFKDRAGKSTVWVEPTRGSSVGLPDAFYIGAGGVWFELKHGYTRGEEVGFVSWRIRPAQVAMIRKIQGAGIPCALLVGFRDAIMVVTDIELIASERTEIPKTGLIEYRDADAVPQIVAAATAGVR